MNWQTRCDEVLDDARKHGEEEQRRANQTTEEWVKEELDKEQTELFTKTEEIDEDGKTVEIYKLEVEEKTEEIPEEIVDVIMNACDDFCAIERK